MGSVDPTGLIDGTNVYAFSQNNPVNFVDKSGTQSVGLIKNSDLGIPAPKGVDLPESVSVDPNVNLSGDGIDPDSPREFKLSEIRSSPNYIDNFTSFGGYGVNPLTSTFEGIRFRFKDGSKKDIPLSSISNYRGSRAINYKSSGGKIFPTNSGAISLNESNTPRIIRALYLMNKRREVASQQNLFFAEIIYAFSNNIAFLGGHNQFTTSLTYKNFSANSFLKQSSIHRKLNFANEKKLSIHFNKHGIEFNAKSKYEYLSIAQSVIDRGVKVKYSYKGEVRTGFIKYMGNNRKGHAKFAFVGTNEKKQITTLHTKSGKDLWKTLNGNANDKTINPTR
ncbi:MAG: hypothetical protein R3E95_10350 [Thiolinea sp.]